jgi:hypothetical protein
MQLDLPLIRQRFEDEDGGKRTNDEECGEGVNLGGAAASCAGDFGRFRRNCAPSGEARNFPPPLEAYLHRPKRDEQAPNYFF